MKITDEMVRAAEMAFYGAPIRTADRAMKDALAAIAPLIAQEAAKEIDMIIAERNRMVDRWEAQAKEIAELRAALAEYQSGRNYLGRALVVKNGQASEDCSGYYQGGKP